VGSEMCIRDRTRRAVEKASIIVENSEQPTISCRDILFPLFRKEFVLLSQILK
jgi:hypothetical protein